MKFSLKLLLIGLVAATVYFVVRGSRRPPNQPQPTGEFASIPVESVSTTSSPAVLHPSRSQKPFDPLAATKVLLRSKLRQRQESEVNDPDDEEGRARLLEEMLGTVTDENVAEIIQSLSGEEMNTPFGNGALHHWMQVDPVAASNWLASRADTTEEQTLTVAGDWIGDREGLKQYLDQLPDIAWKQSFLQAASSEMSLKDPLEAVKLAQQVNPGDAQTNLLRSVACSWVSTDPEAALGWVANVKDPALREQLIASAVQSYAVTDPAQAASWLVSEVKSDEIVRDAAFNILETWVAIDPAAAANWASQFPEGDLKATAVKIVSNHWRQTDPGAAAAWMQKVSGSNQVQAH